MASCALLALQHAHLKRNYALLNDASMQVTTADIIPPNFTAGTPLVSKVDETDFTLLVQLDKPTCTVYFSVLLYTAAQPSLSSVLSCTAPGSLYSGTIVTTGTVGPNCATLCN